TFWETALIVSSVSFTLFVMAIAWVLYIAIEPFVRRRMPHVIVSWMRLLAGDWRDPLVGRDALAGCAAGATLAFLFRVMVLMQSPGYVATPPVSFGFETMVGTGSYVALFVRLLYTETMTGFIGLFLFFFLRILLRNEWAAAAALVVALTVPDLLQVPVAYLTV